VKFPDKVVKKIKARFTVNNVHPKIIPFMEKYCRAGQARDGNIIRRICIACWIPKATDTQKEYVMRLNVHCLTCSGAWRRVTGWMVIAVSRRRVCLISKDRNVEWKTILHRTCDKEIIVKRPVIECSGYSCLFFNSNSTYVLPLKIIR